jgi:hypothetical protein
LVGGDRAVTVSLFVVHCVLHARTSTVLCEAMQPTTYATQVWADTAVSRLAAPPPQIRALKVGTDVIAHMRAAITIAAGAMPLLTKGDKSTR